MSDWFEPVRRFYEYNEFRIWLTLVIGAILGLVFWSAILNSDRDGPRGPSNYR